MRIKSAKTQTSARERVSAGTNVLKPRREVAIDIWRGIAVMLMIITHAIAFFHIGNDPVITNLGIYGGLVSFIMFLFLSGASAFFSYVKYDKNEHGPQLEKRRRRILVRTLFILLGYYLIAIVSSIPQFEFPPTPDTWSVVIKILTLQITPPFTEFILAFVFFNLLLVLLRPLFRLLVRFPLLLIVSGGLLYLGGVLLWQVDLAEPWVSYKALLAGHEDLHTFPIMQFAIVYLLGMSWGKFLFRHNADYLRKRISVYVILVTSLLSFAGIVTFGQLQYSWLDPLLRFPPSLTLMAIGLLSGYLAWTFLQYTGNGRVLGPLQVVLHYMGTKAFDFFIVHTLILFAYKYVSGDRHYESSLVVIGLFLLLMLGSFVFTAVFEGIIANLKESSERKSEFGWILSEKLIVNSIWVVVVVVVGLTVFQNQVSATAINPDDVSFKKRLLREEEWPFWWDHAFYAFRQITVKNETSFPVTTGTWYEFDFNHKQQVDAKHARANGNDLRVVYYDADEDFFFELPFGLSGNNTTSTNIKFALQSPILPGDSDDRYFLYYGNPDVLTSTFAKEAPDTAISAGVSLSEEFKHRLNGSVSKRWHLKEGVSALQLKTMKYTVQLGSDLSPDSIVTFSVVGSEVRGTMDNLGGGKYEAAVPVGELDAGNYLIRATAREPENKLTLITSGNTSFYVTYPLYVVWTQDWEGFPVPDFNWLTSLDQMAKRFDLPMTHFFNPRIYATKAVDSDLADRYTLWVQDRSRLNNDEIGLHLHMWYDMVSAAGVTPRYSPASPWLYGDGGAVLASAYTKDEMKQILNWSKRVFQENGLLPPTSFRAGGWFMAEHTLQALAETGFLIDSSGRTEPSDPRQVAYPPPWHLKVTTRPYQPNTKDMNSEAEPRMNIWEFPNNGADSYWYAAADLVARFHANYPNKGKILNAPQVLNYLSHPQFFRAWNKGGTDESKMTAVFTEASKYLYKNDDGPVVYTTLENAYYGYTPWAREQTFVNQ